MPETVIHCVRVGVTNCHFVGEHGAWILVDVGGPRKEAWLLKEMERLGISRRELRLLILTHGHFDHTGSASAIRDATGARILVHRQDEAMLEEGRFAAPRGFTRWGRVLEAWAPLLERMATLPSTRADIVMEGEQLSLEPYGITAALLHTPGHTPGSLSLLLPGGEALVGDLAFNGSLFCRRPRHVLGLDLEQERRSWKRLLELGMKRAHPGHGRPFPAVSL